MCGEQVLCRVVLFSDVGSSPRVRGTEIQHQLHLQDVGIIPACAGNRVNDAAIEAAKKDHPRVCGEQFESRSNVFSQLGSSPRVRGTARQATASGVSVRIIPACAGNSIWFDSVFRAA